MALEELEDNLLGYMEEEFGVVLEDNSERQLADLIWRMYEGCGRGDVSLAREVVGMAMKAEEQLKTAPVKSVIRSGNGDMDESDDEDGAVVESIGTVDVDGAVVEQAQTYEPQNESNVAMTYASENLFGGPSKPKKELPPPRQLGEPEPEKILPDVDDDGFAVVTKKGKKR